MYRENTVNIILIIIFTFLVYANSLFNSFVWDDFLVIVDNDFVKSWKNFPLIFTKDYLTSASDIRYLGKYRLDSGELSYRPIVTASYFIDYSIWRLNPLGYHFTNIILHIFNALLVYLLIYLLAKDRGISLTASLLFSLHPVNVEAVNCISFREDLLCFLFFISSLISFIKFSQDNKRKIYYYASLILFFLALFSKEMAITLPLVLILYDYYFVYGQNIKKAISNFKSRYLSYILISLFYLWVLFFYMANRHRSLPQYPGASFYTNILTMPGVLTSYIKSLFLPINIYGIIPDFDFDPSFIRYSLLAPSVLLSLALIILCIVVSVKLRKVLPIISFSVFWFFITLGPVYNIFPLENIMARRYLYIPAVGFCLLIASLLFRLGKIKKDVITVFLVSYSIFTITGNLFWKNSLTLWRETHRYYPRNALVYNNIGFSYSSLGQDEKAIESFKKAVQIKPDYALAYYNLARSYTRMNKIKQAISSYAKAIGIYDNFAQAYHELAFIYLTHKELGKIKDAILLYKKAIEIKPDFVEAYNNLGVAYRDLGNINEAVSCHKKAIAINPNYAGAYYNLAIAYKEKGDSDLAEQYYQKAKELGFPSE